MLSTTNLRPKGPGNFLLTQITNYKLSILVFLALLLVFSISIWALYKPNNSVSNNKVETMLSSLTVKVKALQDNVPLIILDSKGNRTQIRNGEKVDLNTGKYTILARVDQDGKTKGIKQEIEVKEKEQLKIEVELKDIELNSDNVSGKALGKPREEKQIPGLEAKEAVIENSNKSEMSQFFPEVILPKQADGEVVAVVQPKYGSLKLVDTSNLVKTENTNNSIGENKTQTSNTNEYTNIDKENQNDLIIKTKDSEKLLASACLVGKVEFSNDGNLLKYFKACDNGQNGFFSYNLSTNQETRILPTSDYTNVIKTASSPVSNLMIWTNPEIGQFGIIQDGKMEVIKDNVYYTAPTFSPDGKYIILADNYLYDLSKEQIKALNLTDSNEDQFGQKIVVVKTEELLNQKDKAQFKEIGKTYFLHRNENLDFKFVKFIDESNFTAGDSSKIFSLTGETPKNNFDSKLPGQIFEDQNKNQYRLYGKALFNHSNQEVLNDVSEVFQLKSKDMYFKSGEFLYRIVDDMPVLAYSNSVSKVEVQENNLKIITSLGQIIVFETE